MGVPGMVLAPVVLDFIKNEASTIEMESPARLSNAREAEELERFES